MPEPGEGAPVVLLAGRYRLGAALGRGGMSTVYRGWDEKLQRWVAVKMFATDDPIAADRERRLREAQVLAAASHPHLVTLFDAEWPAHPDEGQPAFLVMELVEGESLYRRIDRDGADSALALRVCAELGSALAYLHAREIIHRDLKPANILIDGGDGAVKLVDFGIARLNGSERITTAGLVLGTAAYLSPEQVSGEEVGAASDIYSLGLVVLECLTGHREYPGSAAEAGVARLVRRPLIPSGLSQGWQSLLRAMTERDPAARPSASHLVGVVEALLEQDDLPTLDHAASAVSATVPTEPMDTPAGFVTERTGTTLAMEPAGEVVDAPPASARSPWRRFTVVLAALLVAAGLTGGALAWNSLNGQPHAPKHTPTPTVVVTVTPAPTVVLVPAPSNPDGGRQGSGSSPGNGNGGGNGNSGNSGNHGNSGH